MVDIEDSRLKRLGMFFSEEKLERAKELAANFKRKRDEFVANVTSPAAGTKGQKSLDDSSSSSSDTLLENLTEDSRYSSLDSFQTVMREKIIDIKVSKSSTYNHQLSLVNPGRSNWKS